MKTQHSNGFINSNSLSLLSKPCAIRAMKIQAFGDFIDGDFWRFFGGDSRNDKSNTAHSFRRSVYDCSVDFPRSHIAFLPFGNAKCRRMQLRAVHTVAWRTSISPRGVCHNIYKSIVTERKKENPFAGRTTRQCATHFSLPHHRRRMANEQINCTEHVERRRRNDEHEIANQKGALKVVDALVAHSNAVVARKDSPGTL